MAFKGREKHKKVILTKEYLEASRGADLKNFQDQAAALNKQIEDAKTELASIKEKIHRVQEEHRQWLITKTEEITADMDKLEEARDKLIEENEAKKAEIQVLIDEQKAFQSQTLSAEKRIKDEVATNERYLADVQAERSKIENQQIALNRNIQHNQRILNEIEFKRKKSEQDLEALEHKRHELIQIQGRIDVGLERLDDKQAINDETLKQLSELQKDCQEKLAQVDKFEADRREFAAKQDEYDRWISNKAQLEADLENRKRQADIRDKALTKKQDALIKREEIVQKLEKEIQP